MIQCEWFLSPDRSSRTDPVNLVFYGDAPAQKIAHLMHSLPAPWSRAIVSHAMEAFIDDGVHGDGAGWKPADSDLALGSPLQSRRHVRIYECFVPDQHAPPSLSFGRWCIAGVHLEHFELLRDHVVDDWMEPQRYVEQCLANQPFVGSVHRENRGNAGWYQGHWYDGEVTFVEILR